MNLDQDDVTMMNGNDHDTKPMKDTDTPDVTPNGKAQNGAGNANNITRGRQSTPADAAAPINGNGRAPANNAKDQTTASRRSRKRTNQYFPMVASALQRKKPTPNSSSNSTPKKSKSRKPKHDDLSWICCECKEAEAMDDPESDLVLCEGSCHRPFHTVCASGFDSTSDDDPWICVDCTTQRHHCSLCQEFGQDNADVYCCKLKGCGLYFHESCLTSSYNVDIKLVPVVNMDKPAEAAITATSMNGLSSHVENGDTQMMDTATTFTADDDEENAVPETRPEFKCPAHQCWTCTEEMVMVDDPASQEEQSAGDNKTTIKGGKKKRKKKKLDNAFATKNGALIRCLECPIAYHISCIPPVARFHELALLCHDHATTCKLPALDMETSLQGKLERDADRKLESMAATATVKKIRQRPGSSVEEQNIFFLGLHGDTLSQEEVKLHSRMEEYMSKFAKEEKVSPELKQFSFCLPCDLKDEVHAKPPSFRLVHSLRYNPSNRPKRKAASGDDCQCKNNEHTSCGESCHNRFTLVECVGDSSKVNGVKNPYWNCNLGPSCGNRGLGLRQFAKCKAKREQGKGWGLITLAPLKKGDLVQEYVGEIIDEKAKEERLTLWSKDHPNDPNFYIMQLEHGWYIDARVEANLSRFINHSCDPNSVLRPMTVAGYTRIGIYALQDISPGEFLSYDYQFDTKHGDKFICRCGAAKCRGTMKGGKQLSTNDDQEKTLKQALLDAKAREEKDRKYLEEAERIKRANFSEVDILIPDSQYPSESVAGGPHERYRSVGTRNGVFLWRNVVTGGQFSNRAHLLEKKKSQKEIAAKQALLDRLPVDVLGISVALKAPKHVDAATSSLR